MKKAINIFLVLTMLMVTFTFPVNVVHAEESEVQMDIIDKLISEGYEVRKVSTDETIRILAANNKISELEVIAKYGDQLYEQQTTRNDYVYDNYLITKKYSLFFVGVWGTEANHNVLCKIYSNGSFREVYDVYDSSVILESSDYTWERGNVNRSFTSTSISWYEDGNIVLAVSYGISAMAGFFSGSVGSTHYYRKFFTLDSYNSLY